MCRSTRRAFLPLLLAAGCSGGRDGEILPLEVNGVSIWPVPPGNGRAPGPRSLACAPDGRVFALDEVGRVLVYAADGVLKTQWWMPEYSVGRPEGIVVMRDGRIAVSDTHYHRVVVFNADGSLALTFGHEGTAPGEFIYPVAITEAPDGSLAVAEYGGNDRVQFFTPQGAFLRQFGSFGAAVDQLQRPSGIKIREGRVHVADAMNNRVQAYGLADGRHHGALPLPDLAFPYDVDWHPRLGWMVAEYGAGRVTALDADGRTVRRMGRSGRAEGEFLTPWGIAVAPDGAVLVADTGNKRIVRLSLSA